MSTQTYKPRLAAKYTKDVVPALVKKFNYTTKMQAPKLEKICLNRGVNGAVNDKKLIDISLDELTTISGQKAVSTMSKKDISNFKLRKPEMSVRLLEIFGFLKFKWAKLRFIRFLPSGAICRAPLNRPKLVFANISLKINVF